MKFCGDSCNFILKPIVCKDHAVMLGMGSSASCTGEINIHTTEQEVKQNALSRSISVGN